MEPFQPTAFYKFMMGATEFLVTLWLPIVAGSLIAIVGKTLVRVLPVPKGPKNLLMNIAGCVRTVAIVMVLFFFGLLFWSLNHASRQSAALTDQQAIDKALAP
jgi:hypothetical protein